MLAAKDGKEQLVNGLINSSANLNFQDNDLALSIELTDVVNHIRYIQYGNRGYKKN